MQVLFMIIDYSNKKNKELDCLEETTSYLFHMTQDIQLQINLKQKFTLTVSYKMLSEEPGS